MDDCSTDNTLSIIEAFAASAPFLPRWDQNEEKGGWAGNFHMAMTKTTRDLILLSHQNDVWVPEKVERMERYTLEDPYALYRLPVNSVH